MGKSSRRSSYYGKPSEVRMGRGKGNPTGWIARVSTGQIPSEMDGVSLSNARPGKELGRERKCHKDEGKGSAREFGGKVYATEDERESTGERKKEKWGAEESVRQSKREIESVEERKEEFREVRTERARGRGGARERVRNI